MRKKIDIEKILTESAPILSDSVRARMWSQIERTLSKASPRVETSIASPFIFSFMHTRMMIPAVLLLSLILGTSGVAFASEPARPGDFLFPVDRALEDIRLKIATSDEKRSVLLKSFSDERLRELDSIIREELKTISVEETKVVFQDDGDVTSLEIEAYVYLDVTTVKIELNDSKKVYLTHANTREGVIDVVATELPFLTREKIDDSLHFETGNRFSEPKDRGEVELHDGGSARVESAVAEVLAFFDSTNRNENESEEFLEQLHHEIEGLDVEINDERMSIRSDRMRYEVRVDDDGDERIEIRENGSRVRIEKKDDDERVEIKFDEASHESRDEVNFYEDDIRDEWESEDGNDEQERESDDREHNNTDTQPYDRVSDDSSSHDQSEDQNDESNDDTSRENNEEENHSSSEDEKKEAEDALKDAQDDEEKAFKDAEDAEKKALKDVEDEEDEDEERGW